MQTIDTAPKDGTRILGFANRQFTVVFWRESLGEDHWTLAVPGRYAEDAEWNPTHWAPLPKEPTG